jgi:lipopolysaccharide/colanic/teichoic acid biosynthesis glycosyltransferase
MYRKFFKRFFDIFLSFFALIVLSPFFVLIALLVKIKLGSPIIFKQERPGRCEKLFSIYKFRTMSNEIELNGLVLPDSARLSKFGKFLRSTSLDELPELINIFLGSMSIVGPRPLLEKYLPYYTDVERLRHTVRPGLTGLAQVNGRNILSWDKRLALDVKYVKEMSFLLDIKIIGKTLLKVVKRDGIMVVDQFTIKNLDDERKPKNQ